MQRSIQPERKELSRKSGRRALRAREIGVSGPPVSPQESGPGGHFALPKLAERRAIPLPWTREHFLRGLLHPTRTLETSVGFRSTGRLLLQSVPLVREFRSYFGFRMGKVLCFAGAAYSVCEYGEPHLQIPPETRLRHASNKGSSMPSKSGCEKGLVVPEAGPSTSPLHLHCAH